MASKVLHGFPREFKFKTKHELDEYLSGSKIQCLRCGNMYYSLGVHLLRAHAMTPEEYRAIYGIPWRRGLVCAITHKKISERSTEIMADRIEGGFHPEIMQKKCNGTKKRRKQPLTISEGADRLTQYNVKKRAKNPDFNESEIVHKTKKRWEKKGTCLVCGKEFLWHGSTPQKYCSQKCYQSVKTAPEEFVAWWKGRKQTPQHVIKRTIGMVRVKTISEMEESRQRHNAKIRENYYRNRDNRKET